MPPFTEDPRRQPRRDRRPRLPHAARARHRRRSPSTRRPTADELHVAVADEAYLLGPGPAAESLPARRSRSSRSRCAPEPRRSTPATGSSPRTPPSRAQVEDAGLVWIGPPPEAIEAMGSKIAARERMRAAGVPIIPGTHRAGGRPSRTSSRPPTRSGSRSRSRRPRAAEGRACASRAPPRRSSARSTRRGARARRTSPIPTVYVERYLDDPRHVEVQVLADAHGNVDPSRRARLHDPAATPEARRGDAVAGRRRRAPRADRRRSRSMRRAPSATARRERSRACSRTTARTTSSR